MQINYKKCGVNIDKADTFISSISPWAKSTHRREVIAGIGGFGALFRPLWKKYKDPVLVSSTDGVGTKLKIAFMANRHDTVGIDLVAMSVNDILTSGAEPLFFLDYFATGKLKTSAAKDIIKGIIKGCKISNCSLIGGETAEMPSFYQEGEYDLAGFAVGMVEKEKIVDGSKIKEGDILIGLSSSGLHSNGYSLVRKIIFEKLKLSVSRNIKALGGPVGKILLTPTQIYVPLILPLLKRFAILGMAHITGGGLTENIPRIIPKNLAVQIHKKSWTWPAIFKFLESHGPISEEEMLRTFNCGIGFVLIVPHTKASALLQALKRQKQKAFLIGEIVQKKDEEVIYV